MVQYTQEIGLTTFSMGKAKLFGQTDPRSLVTTRKERKMELELIRGMKVTNTKASGKTI